MTTLFISDLHLSSQRPNIIALFHDFLQEDARRSDALYILGDLFDVWIGDDAIPDGISDTLNRILQLTQSGVPVYVMVGNRDFLLGKEFEKLTGASLIADPIVIDLYGTQTLLMHGDTLCTDDIEYQQFRTLVRNPDWQTAFLKKSIEERTAMGQEAREKSQASTQQKSDIIMDTNEDEVMRAFQTHQVRQFIHGHTHRPAIHNTTIDKQIATRIVLGDWYQHSSILTVNTAGYHLSNIR